MKKKEAVKLYIDRNDGWIPAFDLIHHTLCGVWVGNSGDREARRYADENKVQRKSGADLIREGLETDYQDRPLDRTYTYFRSIAPLTKTPIYALLPNGEKKLVATKWE